MPSANVRILAPNSFDGAALTDSPAMVATLPVGNLQDAMRARVARSVGLPNPQYIRGNLASVQALSGFVLWRHNLTTAGSLRLKIWDGMNQSGTLLYDSGAINLGVVKGWGEFTWGIDPWGAPAFSSWAVSYFVQWFAAIQGAMSFEIQISDPANTAGYMEVARVFLGAYFEPQSNFEYGIDLSWEEDTEQERTEGGSLRSDNREPYRLLRLDLNELSDGERALMMEILRLNGKRSDFFVSCFPGFGGNKERDYQFAAKIVQMPKVKHHIPRYFKNELVLAET